MSHSPLQIAALEAQLLEAQEERKILKSAVIKIMDLMGLIDPQTNKMREEIASGDESFVPGMLKSLGDVVQLLMKSNAPKMFGGEKAKEQLAQKFDFIAPLLPIINKYNNQDKD
jgi:hypothetical protein